MYAAPWLSVLKWMAMLGYRVKQYNCPPTFPLPWANIRDLWKNSEHYNMWLWKDEKYWYVCYVFLYKLVSNCFSCFSFFQIRNLNFCQCKICSDCLKQNFEVVIREKHVRHWTCPLCSKPDLNDEELGSEYINFLGMLVSAVCICWVFLLTL